MDARPPSGLQAPGGQGPGAVTRLWGLFPSGPSPQLQLVPRSPFSLWRLPLIFCSSSRLHVLVYFPSSWALTGQSPFRGKPLNPQSTPLPEPKAGTHPSMGGLPGADGRRDGRQLGPPPGQETASLITAFCGS